MPFNIFAVAKRSRHSIHSKISMFKQRMCLWNLILIAVVSSSFFFSVSCVFLAYEFVTREREPKGNIKLPRMSQIILIFVKLNNKQHFINGLTHYNETRPVMRREMWKNVHKEFFSFKVNLIYRPRRADGLGSWLLCLWLAIKLQLWPQQKSRAIFQSKNYKKNVGGRFLWFFLFYEFSSSWFFFDTNARLEIYWHKHNTV